MACDNNDTNWQKMRPQKRAENNRQADIMTLNLTMPEQADLKPRISVLGVGGAGRVYELCIIEREE